MIRFAFSTNAFRKFSLEEALRAIRAAGYEGFELMLDAPHAFPAHLTPEAIAALRETVRAGGMAISNLNAFMMSAVRDFHHPSWIEPDPAFRRLRVEHTAASCRVGQALGATRLSTEPGGPLEGMEEKAAWALFKAGLAEVLPTAEATGVKVLVEPEPSLLIERSDQIARLLDEMPSPWLGMNFDIGHFYCVGEDPAALIRRFGKRVEHVHCEDIKADRRHFHHTPGEGAIDFHAVFEALRAVGYDGWVTVELYPFLDRPGDVAKRALEHLKKVRREVG